MTPVTIRLTHANLKKQIYVPVALIAGWYESPGHACTHVVASGGAVFPALETPEEIERLRNLALSGAATSPKEG